MNTILIKVIITSRVEFVLGIYNVNNCTIILTLYIAVTQFACDKLRYHHVKCQRYISIHAHRPIYIIA